VLIKLVLKLSTGISCCCKLMIPTTYHLYLTKKIHFINLTGIFGSLFMVRRENPSPLCAQPLPKRSRTLSPPPLTLAVLELLLLLSVKLKAAEAWRTVLRKMNGADAPGGGAAPPRMMGDLARSTWPGRRLRLAPESAAGATETSLASCSAPGRVKRRAASPVPFRSSSDSSSMKAPAVKAAAGVVSAWKLIFFLFDRFLKINAQSQQQYTSFGLAFVEAMVAASVFLLVGLVSVFVEVSFETFAH